MRRIALRLPDDGVWTGGVNYLETVCRALLAHPERGYEPLVLCSPQTPQALHSRFAALLGERLVSASELAGGLRAGLLRSVTTGRNAAVAALCARTGVDVVFEAATFYGWRFPVPCLAWVPDFQDRHLPHLFTRRARLQRSLGLRLQLASGRTVLLSSEDARADCERFYAAARGRSAVARFAVRAALAPGECDPQIAARYHLPARFFYLPNQFWAHKNHLCVIEALRRLRTVGETVIVAASGNPQDPRQRDYYARLQAAVAQAALEGAFVFLGEVPRAHVALLMRASVAMLNPSLFEGWSTTVEEAKSLGVRMVLSDLAVHREQVGEGADFFARDDASALAQCLLRVWHRASAPAGLSVQRAAAAAAERRIGEFAGQFTAACEQARTHVRTA